MSTDEFNRKMEFIVEQQAQFASDIQKLTKRQKRLQREQERFQRQLESVHEDIVVLRETARTALDLASQTSETVILLAKAQTDTSQQLTRLARLFEVHVREGHP